MRRPNGGAKTASLKRSAQTTGAQKCSRKIGRCLNGRRLYGRGRIVQLPIDLGIHLYTYISRTVKVLQETLKWLSVEFKTQYLVMLVMRRHKKAKFKSPNGWSTNTIILSYCFYFWLISSWNNLAITFILIQKLSLN